MGLVSWFKSLFELDKSNANHWRKFHGLEINRSAYNYDDPVLTVLQCEPSFALLEAVLHPEFPHPQGLVREQAIVAAAWYYRNKTAQARLAKRIAKASGGNEKEVEGPLAARLQGLLSAAAKADESEQNRSLAQSFLEEPLNGTARRLIWPAKEAKLSKRPRRRE